MHTYISVACGDYLYTVGRILRQSFFFFFSFHRAKRLLFFLKKFILLFVHYYFYCFCIYCASIGSIDIKTYNFIPHTVFACLISIFFLQTQTYRYIYIYIYPYKCICDRLFMFFFFFWYYFLLFFPLRLLAASIIGTLSFYSFLPHEEYE